MKKYFNDIWGGVSTVLQGMRLTLRHLKDARHRHTPTNVNDKDYFLQDTGIVTLTYPYESLPVPDHGRYQLFNEIDDCIVCDKCAVICPVDCIAIDAIKSSEPIGVTSDGSVKRLYAAKFDIDMAKCCFCGLCTSVCPTECLTMTNKYDFSTYEVKEMNFEFTDLTPEQADEKRVLYEQFVKEKEELKKQAAESKAAETNTNTEAKATPGIKIPSFKPVVKLPENKETTGEKPPPPAIKMTMGIKPIIKPIIKKEEGIEPEITQRTEVKNENATPPVIKLPAGLKPVIKPIIKKPESEPFANQIVTPPVIKIPVGLKPIIKPVIKNPESTEPNINFTTETKSETAAATFSVVKIPAGLKPIIKPVIKKPEPPKSE